MSHPLCVKRGLPLKYLFHFSANCTLNFSSIAVFILFMTPKQTGKKAEGRTRDRFDMADPEDEISMADRFHGPDLFELSKKDAGGNQTHES